MMERTGALAEARERAAIPERTRLTTVAIATVISTVAVIFVVQDMARQPVLITSLASSIFLLYHQPLNEINRFTPLVIGHLIAVAVGYAATLLLPMPYISAAASVSATVIILITLRLVHPPAVSTSLVFSYRPTDVSVLTTFLISLGVVVALGAIYIILHRFIRRRHLGRYFGFE